MPPPGARPLRTPLSRPLGHKTPLTPDAPPVPAPAPSHVSGASPAPLPLRRDATRRIYGAPLVTKITTSGGGRLPPCGKLGRLARGCFASPLGGPGRAATSDSRGRCSWGYRAAVGLRPARRLPSGFLGLCATVVFFCFWWAGGQQRSAEPIRSRVRAPRRSEWPRRRGRDERPALRLAAAGAEPRLFFCAGPRNGGGRERRAA